MGTDDANLDIEDISRKVEITSRRPAFFVIILSSLLFFSIFLILVFPGPEVAFFDIIGYIISAGGTMYLTKQEEIKGRGKAILLYFALAVIIVSSVLVFPTIPFEIVLGFAAGLFLIFLKTAPYSIKLVVEEHNDFYYLNKTSDYLFFKSGLRRKLAYDTLVELRVSPRGISTAFFPSGFYNLLVFQEFGRPHEYIEFAPISIRGLNILDLLMKLLPNGTRIQSNLLDRPTGGIFSTLEPKVKSVNTKIIKAENTSTISQFKQLNQLDGKRVLFPSRKSLFAQISVGVMFIIIFMPIAIIFILVGLLGFKDHRIITTFFSILFAGIALQTFGFIFYRFIVNPISLLLGKPKFEEKGGSLLYYYTIGPLKSYVYKIPVSLAPHLVYESNSYSIVCEVNNRPYYKLPLMKTDLPLVL